MTVKYHSKTGSYHGPLVIQNLYLSSTVSTENYLPTNAVIENLSPRSDCWGWDPNSPTYQLCDVKHVILLL